MVQKQVQTQVVEISYIISRFLVRYEKLDQLINFAFSGSNATTINLFVDLYSLYRTIFSRNYRTNIRDYRDFTVGLTDLCAHYRHFFRYRGVHTKIFLISSYNLPQNNLERIPFYNKDMQDKLKNQITKDMVNTNIEMLRLLIPYLPDIHFIQTEFEAANVIHRIIEQEQENPSIILSSDICLTQICTQFNNVAYIWPRKIYGDDNSYIIPPKYHKTYLNEFWRIYLGKEGDFVNFAKYKDMSPSNLVLILAVSDCRERNLKPMILSRSKTFRFIYELISNQDIVLSPEILFKEKDKELNLSDSGKDMIIKRYQCLSEEYQRNYYINSIEAQTLQYENLNDPQAVQLINNKFFEDNPLDLLRL